MMPPMTGVMARGVVVALPHPGGEGIKRPAGESEQVADRAEQPYRAQRGCGGLSGCPRLGDTTTTPVRVIGGIDLWIVPVVAGWVCEEG